jgi:hypothetical protein
MNALYEDLLRKGFLVLDLLNVDECQSLRELINLKISKPIQGFYASSHDLEITESMQLNEFVNAMLAQRMKALFPELKMLGASFAIKAPGEQSMVPAHQDWNIVDESKYQSYNVWLPLIDVNEVNGTLALVEGSHQLPFIYRGYKIEGLFDHAQDKLQPLLKPFDLKAGQAIIYNHKMSHASGNNISERNREVLIFGMCENDAQLQITIHSDKCPAGMLEQLSLEAEDFYRFRFISNYDSLSKNVFVRNPNADYELSAMLSALGKSHLQ